MRAMTIPYEDLPVLHLRIETFESLEHGSVRSPAKILELELSGSLFGLVVFLGECAHASAHLFKILAPGDQIRTRADAAVAGNHSVEIERQHAVDGFGPFNCACAGRVVDER